MGFFNLAKLVSLYVYFIGLLYLFYGFIGLIDGIISWWTPWSVNLQAGFSLAGTLIPSVKADPFRGFVLVVIGLIFVKGGRYLIKGKPDSWGYLTVGLIISGTVAGLNLAITLAHLLDKLYPPLLGLKVNDLHNLMKEGWLTDPGLILFPLALIGYLTYRKIKPL